MQVDRIEIDLISMVLVLATKEGYALKKTQYHTIKELLQAAKQAELLLNKH